ncbi:hypothetical protein GX865_00515 [Candidatus Saccharibacteria bacterium]|jgi:hypothetical protein|nr:hypothetical protein [Candidatus Saccharibacteria bacterium]
MRNANIKPLPCSDVNFGINQLTFALSTSNTSSQAEEIRRESLEALKRFDQNKPLLPKVGLISEDTHMLGWFIGRFGHDLSFHLSCRGEILATPATPYAQHRVNQMVLTDDFLNMLGILRPDEMEMLVKNLKEMFR